MSAIGPTLPPHLANKRKRSGSASSDESSRQGAAKRSRSSTPEAASKTIGIGPPLPSDVAVAEKTSAASQTSRRAIGPSLPSDAGNNERSPGASTTPRRVIGPSLPPTTSSSDVAPSRDEEDSSDDDYGPRLPPVHGAGVSRTEMSRAPSGPALPDPSEAAKPQREEWMLAPPSDTDWTSRIDTTKIKNRKFNTGRGAKGPVSGAGSGVSGLWTETPEEKKRRLEGEILGTNEGQGSGRSKEDDARAEALRRRKEDEDQETRRRVREYDEAHRGKSSLVESLGQKRKKEGKDDDPSKRAFDYERDIAGGVMSGSDQRKLLNSAKGMGGKFDKGRFL